MKFWRNFLVVLALVALSGTIGYGIGQQQAVEVGGSSQELNLSLMWKVKRMLEEKYLDRAAMVDQKMVYGAISGLVASLDDPYTVFLPPTENKSANEDLAGSFGGVGISLGYKEGRLAVMTPLPKTPASRAGLLAGDLILQIVDKNKEVDRETSGIALDEAVGLIRGEIGTEVLLKMYRVGEKGAFEVTLEREEINVASVELEWKEVKGKKVAWVKLYRFSENLYQEWPELVNTINQEKGSNFGGIVLDVRNNPGGFLQASVLVASDFIKEGVVVTQESTGGKKEEYRVDPKRGKLLEDKMVVLVNGGSASAAEILAGALRDFERGKLVGEKTFGKGTVQQPEDFADGSGLHVTVAKWLLPSGKNIHKEGVMPDVEEKWKVENKEGEDNQLDKAIEVLLG